MGKLTSVIEKSERKPPRVIIYGCEGIGKTTFAAHSEKPIFIQTEDGMSGIDAPRFPVSKSFEDVMESLGELATEEHQFKTVVIDSADWLEPLIFDSVCSYYGVDTIGKAAGGYGNGFIKSVEKWNEICNALDYLRDEKGMTSIIIAHGKIKTFNDPENPSYDRYTMKLNEKAGDYLMEWADAVLFAYRRIAVNKTDGQAKAIAVGANGGDRMLRTIASPSCSAKNRYSMPEEIPLEWDAFMSCISK